MKTEHNIDLPCDCQEKYDLVIDRINFMLANDEAEQLIELVDELITWILTSL